MIVQGRQPVQVNPPVNIPPGSIPREWPALALANPPAAFLQHQRPRSPAPTSTNKLRRQLGIPRPRDLATLREQTRERVRRFRERQKERQAKEQQPDPIPGTTRDQKLGGLAAFLKQMVQERHNDFSAEAIAAAMNSPKHFPVELVAELLTELKASGHYDRILAEIAS